MADAWNPDASIAWKVEWHRGRLRAVLADPDQGRFHALAKRFLSMSEPEQRKTLWPQREPA